MIAEQWGLNIKMAEWMIAILIVGAVISIGFNVWNKKNPVRR